MDSGWIGVDLDGTLAHYDGWVSETHIGAPIPAMAERVKGWLAEGKNVRVFTARVGGGRSDPDRSRIIEAIKEWCLENLGQKIPVVCCKDFSMIVLYDDRCVQVETNTGKLVVSEPQKGSE